VTRAKFQQNVGLLVLRLTRRVEGQLCAACVRRSFVQTTTTTALLGWWGVISFFVTPIYLIGNLSAYSQARAVLLSRHGRDGTTPRLPGVAGPLLGCAGAVVLAVLGPVVLMAIAVMATHRTASPNRQAFRDASCRITAWSGQEVFGNTPEAESMARRVNHVLQTVDTLARGGASPAPGLSLSEGHYLTYCELRQAQACFLVHVPSLRSYNQATQEALLKLTWSAASRAVKEAHPGQVTTVGVGLRGPLFYGAVAVGTTADQEPSLRTVDPGADTTPLEALFAGPVPAAAAASTGPVTGPSGPPADRAAR
jgi:hypothetical protein